jgi:hypothetical protein
MKKSFPLQPMTSSETTTEWVTRLLIFALILAELYAVLPKN